MKKKSRYKEVAHSTEYLFLTMKKGRGVQDHLTYQFEVPATEFRKESYIKLLKNKKVKNFIMREFKREKGNVFNGYITSQRPVLISTFKMWLDCTNNQLWPVYPTNTFLSNQRYNTNIVFFKFNGVEEPTVNDEYIVEPIDFEDVSIEEEEDSFELSLSDDEPPRKWSYKQETIKRIKALNQKRIFNMMPYDQDHYVQYCHRKNFDVEKWIDWVWAMYNVHVEGMKPTREEQDIIDNVYFLLPLREMIENKKYI